MKSTSNRKRLPSDNDAKSPLNKELLKEKERDVEKERVKEKVTSTVSKVETPTTPNTPVLATSLKKIELTEVEKQEIIVKS